MAGLQSQDCLSLVDEEENLGIPSESTGVPQQLVQLAAESSY